MHGWETRILLKREAFRSESADDPRVDRDGAVGPGLVDRWLVLHAAATGDPQAGSLDGEH